MDKQMYCFNNGKKYIEFFTSCFSTFQNLYFLTFTWVRELKHFFHTPLPPPPPPPAAAVASGDDLVPLTPGRMSQRQAKERDKEREKEAGLQTPSREHVATPSNLSPGVSYSHGKPSTLAFTSPNGNEATRLVQLPSWLGRLSRPGCCFCSRPARRMQWVDSMARVVANCFSLVTTIFWGQICLGSAVWKMFLFPFCNNFILNNFW